MSVTVPVQGEPTKASTIQALITQLDNQAAAVWAVSTLGILSNGSFEVDDNADLTPDGWTVVLQTAGTGAIDTTTSAHGEQSFKFTSIGGGSGNGGGYIENTEFSECSPNRPLLFHWQVKSSAATVKNKVEIRWFSTPNNADYISTSTLWSEDTNNPSDWICFQGGVVPPSTARYFRIRLTGCDSVSVTAGSTWFDDVGVVPYTFPKRVEYKTAGTYTFVSPIDGLARVALAGGGGGGGGNQGGGAGGGELVYSFSQLIAGTSYTVVVGAAGAGGAGSGDGTSGADSTWQTTQIVAKGGHFGLGFTNGATGGAGGTGGTGDIKTAGQAGNNGSVATPSGNGKGGDSYAGGPGGKGGSGGTDGLGAGAGGGGGASAATGKNGFAGYALIEF